MKPLNIPLGGPLTARHPRRAVWRSGFILLLLFLLWGGVRLQGTANPFLKTVPEETTLMIHLRPTRAQWKTLLDQAGGEILTPTGLTLRELAPFTRGSLVVFLTPSGSVIGLEGALSDAVQSRLRAHGVVIETVGRRLYLLSDTPVSTEPAETHAGRSERIFPGFAGTVVSIAGAPHATIRVRGKRVSVDLPSPPSSPDLPFVNERTIFAGTFSRETPLALPDFVDDAFAFVSGGTSFLNVLQAPGGGSFSLFDDDSFLLRLSSDIPLPLLQKTLLLQYRLLKPERAGRRLSDGSLVEELRLSKNAPALEEMNDDEWIILRVDSEGQQLFAGKHKTREEAFFTNSADILIEKTSGARETLPTLPCGNSPELVILHPSFLHHIQEGNNYFSTPIPLSNSRFVHVGMDKSIFGVKIRFCVDKNDPQTDA